MFSQKRNNKIYFAIKIRTIYLGVLRAILVLKRLLLERRPWGGGRESRNPLCGHTRTPRDRFLLPQWASPQVEVFVVVVAVIDIPRL